MTHETQQEIETAAQQLTWLVTVRTGLVVNATRGLLTQLATSEAAVDPELALDVGVKIVNSVIYNQPIAPVTPDYAIALGENNAESK